MPQQNANTEATFNRRSPIFMSAKVSHENSQIGIFGVPYDGTTSFKPGTRFGPIAICDASICLESYCPQLQMDLEELSFTDFGCLEIPYGAPEPVVKEVKKATSKLIKLGLKPLMLGGEHSITSGAVSAVAEYYPDLILIQLDAHADLREEWLGTKHSHACSMRRCLEVLPSKKLFQLAIRSGTKEEFKEIITSKRYIHYRTGNGSVELESALKVYKGRPLYITIDLDWFDPSVMPGTGTPEPGGFLWNDFAAVVEILRDHQIVAADIVELAPQIDPSGISSVLAAKVTRSLIMLMHQ